MTALKVQESVKLKVKRQLKVKAKVMAMAALKAKVKLKVKVPTEETQGDGELIQLENNIADSWTTLFGPVGELVLSWAYEVGLPTSHDWLHRLE